MTVPDLPAILKLLRESQAMAARYAGAILKSHEGKHVDSRVTTFALLILAAKACRLIGLDKRAAMGLFRGAVDDAEATMTDRIKTTAPGGDA